MEELSPVSSNGLYNVSNAFDLMIRLHFKEKRKAELMSQLADSLIHKFTPQILQMDDEQRYRVTEDVLVLWMLKTRLLRLRLDDVRGHPLLTSLLGLPLDPSLKEFMSVLNKLPRKKLQYVVRYRRDRTTEESKSALQLVMEEADELLKAGIDDE